MSRRGTRRDSRRLSSIDENAVSLHRDRFRSRRRSRRRALVALIIVACTLAFGTFVTTLFTVPKDRRRSTALVGSPSIWRSADRLVLPPALASAPLLDTRPIKRSAPLAGSDNGQTKYLAYRPTGQFNNQRIALQNAIALAHALDRTLLVPPARLGRVLGTIIEDEDALRRHEFEDKDGLLACSRFLVELERLDQDSLDRALVPDECRHYAQCASQRSCARD